MKTALFIMMPFPSHFFAGFNLARQLQARGYRIVFAGRPYSQPIIEKEGFTFRSLTYATEFCSITPKLWIALFMKSLFDQTYTRQRYKEFCQEANALYALLNQENPDLLIVDSRLSYYALLLRQKVKVVIFNTKLSTKQATGVPPLESTRISSNSLPDRLFAAFTWFSLIKWYQLRIMLRKAALLNRDESYFYKRFMKGKGAFTSAGNHLLDSYHPALEQIPKLITYPKALEYSWKGPTADEWYIEMPFVRDESKYWTPQYEATIAWLLEQKKTAGPQTHIVYCSLGTLVESQAIRTKLFLEKVLKAVRNLPQIQLILTTGGVQVDRQQSNNIHVLDKVPQLSLLKHCDLMITHGGLNSMTECLQAGVPMLAAPLILGSDHCGNVARIEANGFGLAGDMLLDTPENIRTKILRILSDPSYRDRVRNARLQTPTEQEELMDQLLETALVKA